MREGERKITKTQKKNSITSHGSPCTPQNLVTQLATANLLLAIHSTELCSSEDSSQWLSDLTVKRDSLRKHVQPQIYCRSTCTMITDHWVHGDLQCVDLHDQLLVFFSAPLSEINARDRREAKKQKKTTLLKGSQPAFVFHHHAIPKPYITIQDTCYMSHRLLQARITSAPRPRDRWPHLRWS